MDFYYIKSLTGLFYLTFLPGYVLLKIIRLSPRLSRDIFLGFGLSLTINYVIVFILGTLRIINFFSIWATFFVFLLALIILLFFEYKKDKETFYRSLFTTSLAILSLVFFWLFNQYVVNSGSIAWGSDDLFSWNDWAIQWYKNNPVWYLANFYVQLLPVTWATSYLFSGTYAIQFFARSLMPIFFFYILLAGFDTFLQRRNILYLMSFIGLGWLFLVWKGFPRMTLGLADIPASFLAFSSLQMILQAQDEERRNRFKMLIIGAILASASAVTKQYGMVYLMSYIPLSYFILNDHKEKSFFKKILFSTIVPALIIAAPWYIYAFVEGKYYQRSGAIFREGSFERFKPDREVSSEAHNVSILRAKIVNSFKILQNSFTNPVLLVIVVIFSIFSLVYFPFRLIWLFSLFPLYLLWMLLVAYDIRNFTMGMLFMVFISGAGMAFCLELVFDKEKINKTLSTIIERLHFFFSSILKSSRIAFFVFMASIITVISFNFLFTYPFLHKRFIERQKKYLGDHRDINAMLYSYIESKGQKAPLYTDYCFVPYMPDISYIYGNFEDLKYLKSLVDSKKIGTILIIKQWNHKSKISTDVEQLLRAYLNSGKLQKISECENGYLLEVSED